LIAAENLSVQSNRCVVFEDAVAGIQAANNAGMVSIGIGNKKVLSDAKYNFNNFTEINTTFLEQLLQ